jgi:hypothetical protein
MEVRLEWHEVQMGAQVGLARHVEAIRKGLIDRRKDISRTWDQHICGALGEMAAAKALNCHWSGGINTFKGADIGRNIQVRTRPFDTDRVKYDLIVRDADKDSDVFILVQGESDRFVIGGWITGRDAKREDWRRNYGGHQESWFVPKDGLWPIEQLNRKEVA